MKRKLFWAAFSYLLGIYTSLLFGLKSVFLGVVIFLLALAVKNFIRFLKTDIYLIICAAFMLFGSFYISYENRVDKSFIANFKGQTVTVSAKIKSFPEQGSKYFSAEAKASYLTYQGRKYQLDENVSVRLYDKKCSFSPGDNVLLTAKVLMPLSSKNVAEDYSLYLKTKKIYTILSVKSGNCTFVSHSKPTFSEKLIILRKNLSAVIYKYLPGREASLMCAMLLGDKSGIDEKTTEAFSNSGLSHVIAVSGLHVNAISATIYLLLSYFGISKRRSSLFVIAFLIIYVPLTGMSPSAVRAGIMALLFIISQLILRRADALTSLAFAALVITVQNPFYAFSVSFMLSFGATLGILLFAGKITNMLLKVLGVRRENKALYAVISSLAITFSAQVICAPVIVIYFGTFTLWTFFANLLVVPLLAYLFCGGMVLLAADFIYAPAAKIASCFTFPLLKGILFVADFFGKPQSGIIKAEISEQSLLLYALFMFLLHRFLSLNEKFQKRR